MIFGSKWLIEAVGFKRDGDGVLEDEKEDDSNNSVSVPLLRVYARQLTKSIGVTRSSNHDP